MNVLSFHLLPLMNPATIRPKSRRRPRPTPRLYPFLPLTPTLPAKMKGDLQEVCRHGEDAPIVFMDVEVWLLNMTKMQWNLWDEDGQETEAICEMAKEAVWRRTPCNTTPPSRRQPPRHTSHLSPTPNIPPANSYRVRQSSNAQYAHRGVRQKKGFPHSKNIAEDGDPQSNWRRHRENDGRRPS